MMNFLWPEMLWLLLALPALVAFYLFLLRRKKKEALRYANLALLKEAMSTRSRFRQHLPPLLFLLAIAGLLLAVARPAAVVTLPSQQQTIILAIDVSGSMRAEDVEPNRLVAAQEAAKAFVTGLPRHVRAGVVSFAGTAAVVQPPTVNREDIIAAIDRFQLQRGTAIGSGILLSLATIFPEDGINVSEATHGSRGWHAFPLDSEAKPEPKTFTPVPPGSHPSAAIILLTDGQRTTGPDPLEASRMAADRGVRIFTVGVGTPEGAVIGFEGWSFHARLDEETLKAVSDLTLGEYSHAGTATDLKKVYQSLSARLVLEKKQTEITALFSAVAAGLALISVLLSLLWFNRVL
jgi:Ca-activated chloride channel family protein